MSVQFNKSESWICTLFREAGEFEFEGSCYRVQKVGKPITADGEPKTDIYVLGCSAVQEKELKISYKQKNADFLENKITAERAQQILGDAWQDIIRQAVLSIKDKFECRPLIFKHKKRRTQPGSITLGWKFELLNKPAGALSGVIPLSVDQVRDIYAGTHLSPEKKNACVQNEVISHSGVANYMLVQNIEPKSVQEVIDQIVPIDIYAEQHPQVFFACKALNYRTFDRKYDGNRSLAVYVDWTVKDNKLHAQLVFDKPLQHKGNEAYKQLMHALAALKVTTTDDLGQHNVAQPELIYGS